MLPGLSFGIFDVPLVVVSFEKSFSKPCVVILLGITCALLFGIFDVFRCDVVLGLVRDLLHDLVRARACDRGAGMRCDVAIIHSPFVVRRSPFAVTSKVQFFIIPYLVQSLQY